MTHWLGRFLMLVFLGMIPVVAACGGGASGPTSATTDSSSALAVGPDFTAQEADGGQVTLSEALEESENVVLVFYRGVF